MGVVKYSGPVASFHCPTNAEIRSLKVHFSPKQEGSGDPSPENVREIVGWDGVEVQQTQKNLMHLLGYSAVNLTTTTATRKLTNGNGTTINTIDPEKSVIITQTLWPATNKYSYQNGYFIVMDDNLKFEERYDISFRVTNITSNPLNATLSDLMLYNPKGTSIGSIKIIDGDRITFKNAIYNQNTATPLRHGFDIRVCGMSCTISDFIVTAVDTEDRTYEPYNGSTTDYEFGVLGKNKFNWDVPVSEASPVSSDAATAREFTLDTYIIGMSVNNYYRQNYANWVLNPSVENGVISFSSGAASGYGIAFPLKLAAGQTYFLSGTSNGVVGATYYNEDGELISYQNGRLNKTITVPDNAATTLIGFYANTSNTDFTFSNIQLELGSSATTYEPYNPNKTVYGGWVDLITGEVCEEWVKHDMSQINIAPPSSTSAPWDHIFTIRGVWSETSYDKKYGIDNVVCEVARRRVGSESYANGIMNAISNSSAIYFYDDTVETEEEFKEKYAGKYIAYETNFPVNYSLAPLEMQTFLSTNNVWSNADYVEVEYDLHETQNILARKQFIMANQPHVVKPAAAPLQNFVTDMAAPLKSCKVYFSPVQDTSNGAPSPDNICPISGWTGVEVYRTGKNLCSRPEGGGDYMPLLIPSGIYVTASSNLGGNVTLQSTIDGSFIRYSQVSKDGNRKYEVTFDVPENKDTYRFNRSAASQSCQLELGSIATTYEPYTGTTIPITFPSEAGTVYGGYVDLVKGEVVAEYVYMDMTEMNFNRYSAGTIVNIYSCFPGTIPQRNAMYCNILQPVSNPNVSNIEGIDWNKNRVNVCLNASRGIDSVSAFMAWLQAFKSNGQTPTLIAKVSEPIHHPIDLSTLKTLRGTNNIWSNANGNIELSYWKH